MTLASAELSHLAFRLRLRHLLCSMALCAERAHSPRSLLAAPPGHLRGSLAWFFRMPPMTEHEEVFANLWSCVPACNLPTLPRLAGLQEGWRHFMAVQIHYLLSLGTTVQLGFC